MTVPGWRGILLPRIGVCLVCASTVTGLGGGSALFAQQRVPVDLIEMSLEELLALEITSAGKKEQLVVETAAAVYVITDDDIRRSQATTIMELLRQVPGMQVAREDTGEWAISIRGFGSKAANKLLVLMDGRSLYTPVYTGVEWDGQDTLLTDIDRIEIIRGPGATVWGANAVNGVINIITKDAKDTQGGAVNYQMGSLEKGTIAARYGGALGDTAHYRVFSKYFNRRSMPDTDGATAWGGWESARQGGRLDWAPSSQDHVTITSEWSLNNVREIDDEITAATFPFEAVVEERDRTNASFLLGRWSRKHGNGSGFDVQFFHDRSRQYDARGSDRDESVATSDVEFQYHLNQHGRHDLVWGGGFRQVRDQVKGALDSWFAPTRFTARTYNGFLQDEVAWRDRSVRFTAGSKVEWNSFSGIEVQPTVRLLWLPSERHSLWTAASRAVRVPSRSEVHQYSIEDVEEDEGEVTYGLIFPSQLFKPEKLLAYEAGYRFIPTRRFSVDVSSFYNAYTDLETIDSGSAEETVLPVAGLMTPLVRSNGGYGKVYGAEVLAFWTVNAALQVSGSYARLQMRMDPTGLAHDENGARIEEQSAPNMFFARAYADLPYRVEMNGELRYVGAIPGQEVDGYVDGNVHVSRAVTRGVRLHLSIDNLLHRHHAEWDEGGLVLPRSVRAGFDWRF
jgi:iron complex outermembrane receptor protein